jgi:hypothetical protein
MRLGGGTAAAMGAGMGLGTGEAGCIAGRAVCGRGGRASAASAAAASGGAGRGAAGAWGAAAGLRAVRALGLPLSGSSWSARGHGAMRGRLKLGPTDGTCCWNSACNSAAPNALESQPQEPTFQGERHHKVRTSIAWP